MAPRKDAHSLNESSRDKWSIATRAVHAGERLGRPEFTPVVTPIYPGTTYLYEDLEVMDAALGGAEGKYVYTRYGNPTTNALETAIANLEGTTSAIAFASGMAAVHAAITTSVSPGDTILASQELYGQTYSGLTGFFTEWGCTVETVDVLDLAAVQRAVDRLKPSLIICETISNPLMRVTDIPAIASIARSCRATLMVDSTFAPPVIYQPANDGAHLVVHSMTKYIGGHGDVTGGVVATSRMRRDKLHEYAKLAGSILGPFESWLTMRGLKTLPLRYRRQCESAGIVAVALAENPMVEHVNFPGLSTDQSHPTASRMFEGRGYGAMISFDIRGAGQEQVFAFLEALELVVPATTLGDVYSLSLYPAMSSHRSMPAELRHAIGIGDGLVRLSVGIEEPADIIADLDQALRIASNM
jgi:cystathionine beta-lyase/cystathionine gamma-synthase